MAKRSTKSTTSEAKETQPATPKPKSPAQMAVQAAGKITGDLVCLLQTERKSFLHIGRLLTEVRDQRHFAALNHLSIEDYADEHLGLRKTSLYRYLKVYAWALEHHKEWLEVPLKVRIPDFSSIEGLLWVEQELEKKDLSAGRKKTLEDIQQKALDGKLRQKELRAVKARTNSTKEGDQNLISATRTLRKRYAQSVSVSAQKALPHFDEIISIMDGEQETAFLSILDTWVPKLHHAEFFSHNSRLA
jgi:hypothetical protein